MISIRIRFLSLLVLLFVSLQLAGQEEKPNYQLLWEISGNGHEKPSYLFGTMHVKDKRAFEFSDSLLYKLEATEGFALEVMPDSLIKYMLSNMWNEKDTVNLWEQMFDNQESQAVDKALQKETGLSLKQLKNKNPWTLNQLLDRKRPKEQEMNTFLDAYLYDLARKQGKAVYGLEDIQQHMAVGNKVIQDWLKEEILEKVMQGSDIEAKKEKTLAMYRQGDIDALLEEYHDYKLANEEGYRALLTDRNVVMAKRMEELMKEQSMFVAVGAAHLPGDDGLIALLRKDGYHVRPVTATFTGMADKYVVPEKEIPWQTFTSSKDGYQVDFPGEPVPIPYEGLLTFHINMDLGSGLVYYATSVEAMKQVKDSEKDLLKQMEKSMGKRPGTEVVESKKVTFKGWEARDIVFSSFDEWYFRILFFFDGEQLYMLMIGGNEDNLHSKDAERFLASFKKTEKEASEAYELVNDAGAFSIDFPAKPLFQQKAYEVEKDLYQNLLMWILYYPQANSILLFRYNDVAHGYYVDQDSAYLQQTIEVMQSTLPGSEITVNEPFEFHGYPARKFKIEAEIKGDNVAMGGMVILRGGRIYFIGTSSLPEYFDSEPVQAFIQSFTFRDYAMSPWTTVDSVQDFTVALPQAPHFSTDTLEGYSFEGVDVEQQYAALDSNTAFSYVTIINQFSPFYANVNIDSFYNDMTEKYKSYNDSISYSHDTTWQGLHIRDITLATKASHNQKHYRLILNGQNLYVLFTALPKGEEQPWLSKFYDSFKIKGKKDQDELFKDKARELLAALSSEDSVEKQAALKMVTKYDFKEEHGPYIIEALRQPTEDDTLNLYQNPKRKLITQLTELEYPGLEDLFDSLYHIYSGNDAIRIALLQGLANLRTEVATKHLEKLLLNDRTAPQGTFQGFQIFGPYRDSLELFRYFSPAIYNLLSDADYEYGMAYTLRLMMDSGIVRATDLTPQKDQILSLLHDKYDTIMNREEDEYYSPSLSTVVPLLEITGFLPLTDSDFDFIKRYVELPELAYAEPATVVLLQNRQKVSRKILKRLAKDMEQRIYFYRDLKRKGLGTHFPSRYAKPESLAQSDLYNSLIYEDYGIDKIEFLQKKEIIYNDEKSILYIFKYNYDYEKDSWYLGFSGPHPLEGFSVKTWNDWTGTDYGSYDPATLEADIAEYVESREE